jgi:virginiamycin A acetyltransferase
MKHVIKSLSCLPVLLLLLFYRIHVIGFLTAGRLLAVLPGRLGAWWRAAWYKWTLVSCGEELYIDWMSVIRTPRTRIGHRVIVGPCTWIGWADVGDDVMFGGYDSVLSGAHHHAFESFDMPINQQRGIPSQVKIGNDVWIGNGAIIMADVAPGTVVGAGAVVSKTFEPQMVLAGVPAKPLRRRGEKTMPLEKS